MAKQISALPTAPSTQRPATFNTEADAFVAALPTFVSEANALATEAATNAQRSEDANTTAQSAKESAQTSAQTASEAKEAVARSASEAESSAQAASEAKTAAATSAKEAKERAQAVAETKEELSGSLGALEEMKKIVATGFIDDTEKRANLTYSSKKIETDFAPKNESSGEQKIYGKPLSAAGEASSVVVRDASGYISSSTPKSEEFTADHLVCVRGSDGKEKFVPLETIYKNVLERILKENLPLVAYDVYSLAQASIGFDKTIRWGKVLKNSSIFLGADYGNYKIVTPDFIEVPLPFPGGAFSGNLVFLANDDKSIFLIANNKFYQLVDTEADVKWEEIAAKKDNVTLSFIEQTANKFLYARDNDSIYRYDGHAWTDIGYSGGSAYTRVEFDKIEQKSTRLFNDFFFYENNFIYYKKDNKFYEYDFVTAKTRDIGYHKGLMVSSRFYIDKDGRTRYNESSSHKDYFWYLFNTSNSKTTEIPQPYNANVYQNTWGYSYPIIKIGNEYYGTMHLRDAVTAAKYNKAMLAYYGAEI